MFSHKFYEVLHLVSIFLFIGALGVSFALASSPKWAKILSGISTLLIFVAGMGLIARLGIGHGDPWPKWIIVKITLWMALAIGAPVLSKRLKGPARIKALGFFMVVFAFLAYLGVYHPF